MLVAEEAYMSAALRERSVDTVHDQIVGFVAQRWAKAFVCKVTIKAGLEQNTPADPNQSCDIVGWYVSSGGNTTEWMAEVETEESLADLQIVDKWNRSIKRGIPFYLVVPGGMKDHALKLTQDRSLVVSCIYEYTFINGVCHLL
jgi:hypothetical protein